MVKINQEECLIMLDGRQLYHQNGGRWPSKRLAPSFALVPGRIRATIMDLLPFCFFMVRWLNYIANSASKNSSSSQKTALLGLQYSFSELP